MKGVVTKVFGRYFTVAHDGGSCNCVLMGKLRLGRESDRFSEAAAVGDFVELSLNDDGTGAILSVHERRNAFTRKDKGRTGEDLIAANLDQVVVVQSFARPRLNLRFVDRVLVRGVKERVPVCLCVNKSDLAGPGHGDYVLDYYRDTGIPVILVSARTGDGVEDLRPQLSGRLSLFIGSSGVGKSTLLNRLYPGLALRTSEISESTGKGRHTTTNVGMVTLPDGARVIDTPGFREFGLMDIEPRELEGYFTDFRKHRQKCRFIPCTHDHEPDCRVKRMVETGKIHEERYISYLNILRTLQEYHDTRFA
jgi:ribosome biogenesis GTPase / thiamine phosphate phosphatase